MDHILIVDDDTDLLDILAQYFTRKGYQVSRAETGEAALALLEQLRLDCLLLDYDLAGMDGFSVCAVVRTTSSVPIIFLSSYTEAESRIRGLEVGGDDYVCKPVSLEELELRVRLRIRTRREILPEPVMAVGGLTLDSGRRTAAAGGRTVAFSQLEFELLAFLVRHPGQPFHYEQLSLHVWQEPLHAGLHNIHACMAKVRRKLEQISPDRRYVKTLRGKGYYFEP